MNKTQSFIICSFVVLLLANFAHAQSIAGTRVVGMGGYAAALTWDPAAIYCNPANASKEGKLQLEFFGTDTIVALTENWGAAVLRPSDQNASGAGVLFLRRNFFRDSVQYRSSQVLLAIVDERFGIPVGFGVKGIWEQAGYGNKWTGGFVADLGTLVSLGPIKLGASAKSVFGMKTKTEPGRYEAGMASKLGPVLLSAGVSTRDFVLKRMREQVGKNWGYGVELQALHNAGMRAGRFMGGGRIGESAGAYFSTDDQGITLGYSARRYLDQPDQWIHWFSYTYTANVDL